MSANYITLIFVFIHVMGYGQGLAERQDSVALTTVISQLEAEQSYEFYYRAAWLKDVYLSRPVPANIDSLAVELKRQSDLSIYMEGREVYLLKDAKIIVDPAIATYFEESPGAILDDEVLFLNEMENVNAVEEKLIYLGKRNAYQKDGKNTIAGYIREQGSGDAVDGAFVYVESPFVGTSTDATGFYSLTVPSGKRKMIVQSVNLKNTSRQLMVFSDAKLDLELQVDVIALEAVTVHAEREENIKTAQMGLTKITPAELSVVPAMLGEKDLVRVATTTAGVQNIGEGAAGINIRGGKADQNLFMLDGATLFNTNHFFGFFSVFNADAVQGMNLYKSSIPAEYGGRLSSVFDVESKKASRDLSVSGGISPVTSRLMVEGGIGEKGPDFVVAGRATYSDYILQKIKDSPLKNNEAAFQDLMVKVHQVVNDKNEWVVTGYLSNDQFQLSSDTLLSYSNFSYSNRLLAVNWDHVFSSQLNGNFRFTSSEYAYHIGYDVLPSQAFDLDFSVKEKTLAAKMDYFVSEQLNYKFGLEAKYLKVHPGTKRANAAASLVANDEIASEQGLDLGPYWSADYSPSDRLSLSAGLRYSIYAALGAASVNTYDANRPKDINAVVGAEAIEKGEVIKPIHHGPEYRLSARYSLGESSSLKAAANRTRQNMHLLLNAASIAPTDMWRLSGRHIESQIADQISVGYFKNFYGRHTIEASAEMYYKRIQNLLDFKVGADLQFNKHVETDILQGNGKAYGLELSVKKSSGWLTGWINYTYSRSLIQLKGDFPEETINGGVYFPTGYDKPHYLNSITNYKFTRRFTMTLNVVYATGVPATFPEGKYTYQGSENLLYSERNAHRIPDYFRTDIGVSLEGNHKVRKLAHSSWSFSIYNLLGRDNVYSVFFKVEDGEAKGYKMSIFSHAIPTLTYNFKF